jgi:hypothetical protein
MGVILVLVNKGDVENALQRGGKYTNSGERSRKAHVVFSARRNISSMYCGENDKAIPSVTVCPSVRTRKMKWIFFSPGPGVHAGSSPASSRTRCGE